MSKSPINFLGAAATSIVGGLRGSKGRKGIKKKLDILTTKVDNIAKNMPRRSRPGMMDSGTNVIGPGTNAPGAVVNESPDILGEPINNTGVVAGSSFDPSTLSTAENIFGKPMEDSYDRDLGVPTDELI